MLEGLAAWVLKYYLGKYVENLNTDQLSIGILQGEVELENLPLKREALRQVGLPVQITAGYIGKVKLQIPFRQIRTAPWVILIEKLYLVASPVNVEEWDEEAEEQLVLEQKLNVLDALEAQWRANESQDQSYYASSYSTWMNFGTSIVSNIIETIQLNISDVHIRYEDDITLGNGQCFAFGMSVDSLVAQSCNEDWHEGLHARGNIGYKLVQLSKFSIYWEDCLKTDILGTMQAADFIDYMGKSEMRGKHFLLSHVSGSAHLRRNRSFDPLRSRSSPRFICDVLFDEFPITISDKQYSEMVVWTKGLAVIATRIKNNRLRPRCNVSESPSSWWRYLVMAVMKRGGSALCRTWQQVQQRARDNIAYVKLYEKVLTIPGGAPSEEDKALKDRVELEQSLEQLQALRETAMRKVRVPPPATPAVTQTSYIAAWFSQWWYTNPSAPTLGEEEGKKLKEEIMDALDNPIDDSTFLRRDVVFGQFNFSLKQGSITLCACASSSMNSSEPVLQSMLELEFETLLLGFESRPRSGSYKCTVALGGVFLKDHLTKDSVFPVLVAPQGRDTAPSSVGTKRGFPSSLARLLPGFRRSSESAESTLFQLTYEFKPFSCNVDHRLHLRTQSLDIVYNPAAVSFLTDFFTKTSTPSDYYSLRSAARQKYQAIKTATKNELLKSWEQILAGDMSDRKTWDLDLDISAPQVMFVEHFCDKNAVIVVVDLGHLRFTNCAPCLEKAYSEEDEETFETPCSTPPGSESSPVSRGLPTSSLNELSLHDKLYDRYTFQLDDMQVLVGKVRDNWKHAHLKGTSALHVLDRFSISMQVERRVVYTTDPQFPSLTLHGNLPRLVVHVNEQKVAALRAIYSIVSGQSVPSPLRSSGQDVGVESKTESGDRTSGFSDQAEPSKLIMMQFTVQHLALEVQSRSRSIAELQVSGVRAACTLRPFDTSLTLSVHSLLLVDALQTFGRDFELLVASHKHVGMDSVSGILRDSEPTSPQPTSPGSPEPATSPTAHSPLVLSQALSSLQQLRAVSPTGAVSPPPHHCVDSEALISVELTLISGNCPGHDGQPLQLGAIQFNNLDIIANQETIVELLGFARRVFPPAKPGPSCPPMKETGTWRREDRCNSPAPDASAATRTEATFDFHRLNILLLRGIMKDGLVIGRKICTATVTQAKIKATVGRELVVEGSLGGIQVLDLTPEAQKHRRIISLGADPLAPDSLADLEAGLYSSYTMADDKSAFHFCVKRPLESNLRECEVVVRMASVWYTHSPQLVSELQSCATEFKQYLANLARSIKLAATEMAMGFVHARAEALVQSLSMSGRLSASLYGGSIPDVGSPRKRRRSLTQSVETLGTTPHTPYSPVDDELLESVELLLDVVVETPVIVVPQSPSSEHVFVAQLGKITLRNSCVERDDSWGYGYLERFHVDVRDMNVYSVSANVHDVSASSAILSGESTLPRPEKMYACDNGKPILHNTVIELSIERRVGGGARPWDLELESEPEHKIEISGGVVGPLKVSLSRAQYRQLINTMDHMLAAESLEVKPSAKDAGKRLDNIEEETGVETGVSALSLDPALRARMLNASGGSVSGSKLKVPVPAPAQHLPAQVTFELPEFTVELIGGEGYTEEKGLVSISFRDYQLTYDQTSSGVYNVQMSLRSLVMEDLLVPNDARNRLLVVSSATREARSTMSLSSASQSCPNLTRGPYLLPVHKSLPDRLYVPASQSGRPGPGVRAACPSTPPPSPRGHSPGIPALSREENLVLINILMVDRDAPQYSNLDRTVTIDFNCLDVIANIESWVVIFDFFGVERDKAAVAVSTWSDPAPPPQLVNTKMDLEVRSLTLVLVRPEYEVARANMSHLMVLTKQKGAEYSLEGRLGSMSIADLTPQGKLYRERFLTSGSQALKVHYVSYGGPARQARPCDAELRLEMSSVVYVHTQRFLAEVQAYFDKFSQLQSLMAAMRASDKDHDKGRLPSSRLLLLVNAGSPVLLLPLSSSSAEVLVADLGKLTVRNVFRRSSSDGTTVDCLLDVMTIDLVNMDLFAGRRTASASAECRESLQFGPLHIVKEGPSLLPDKVPTNLRLEVDRNLDTHLSREVPDLSVRATLERLEASLDLSQYRLIRGLLSYNIGENLGDLYSAPAPHKPLGRQTASSEPVWLSSSIQLDLVNVVVQLRHSHARGASLACVNFIKSRLVVETLSDRSQDIDLVSTEILVTDTRYTDEPMNKRFNVFTNILQPLVQPRNGEERRESEEALVQAEIHHRRRRDYSKTTVLLHNMRLMAVLDWWEIIRDFIAENAVVDNAASVPVQLAAPQTHMSASVGVVTKHPPVLTGDATPFEFKLNITDSEVVVVEDTSVWSTNAIILKSTTVISYRPSMLEKPLSCNLNHCEVFSCILGMENQTALSIIDPVTVNMEVTVKSPATTQARGISDAMTTAADRTLEVQLQHLCVRLSYHDCRMLAHMLESVPRQTFKARNQVNTRPANVISQLAKLSALGFTMDDCTRALELSGGQLDEAALWLTQNAMHVPSDDEASATGNTSSISFQTIEVKLSSLSVCVIDDCLDADVPLVELSLSQLCLKQELGGQGMAKLVLTSDYYNRVLSGWEPFVEPWRCCLHWERSLSSSLSRNRLQVQLMSEELLNINLTSTLMDLFTVVKNNWMQDYYSPSYKAQAPGVVSLRRRAPFVPYALKNDTGSVVWFTTLVTSAVNVSEPLALTRDHSWLRVNPDETVPFTFGEQGKIRHEDTHKVRIHQLVVQVDMWRPVSPVSIDKVGVYFRQVVPEADFTPMNIPPARVVFDVTLEGSARKLVTVRSALTVSNGLSDAVEMKLENTLVHSEAWDPVICMQIPPGTSVSVPMSHALAHLWIRPIDGQNLKRYHAFSSCPLDWAAVKDAGKVWQLHQCHSNRDRCYRFVACIRRYQLPSWWACQWPQPAHTISLLSPVAITNLLPCDLHYSVREASISGYVKPGMTANVHEVDCERRMEISLHLEAFRNGSLIIPAPSSNKVRLTDETGRRLELNASVQMHGGARIRVVVSAPLWVINKTSLPLVFKQEGAAGEAAGQLEEHEVARVVTPLLLSLSDSEASPMLQARLGFGCHGDRSPQWCQHFHVQVGSQVRRLKASHRDLRPDVEYVVGISIRQGRGRYRDTNIITLSPRYQLHNKSCYQLQFAQECLATTLSDPGASATHATAVKDCSLAWHWPRLDKELLLCVRLLDVPHCLWSGGFHIDNDYSSHLNVRDKQGKMHLLRVEIVLQGATYFTVFTDADTMPPPIRLDNFSQVPIQFYQSCQQELQGTVRPQTCVPYAWDQPLGPARVTLVAPGGASASYDINTESEDGSMSLTYENFIYLAFTGTFNNVEGSNSSCFDPLDVESQQLVLDCTDGYHVVLNRKQHGVRSQLWRMTSEGQLQHEGSSPPRDPRSKSTQSSETMLVLDIAGTAPQPTQCVALVLRRPDRRRKSTQTWRFTNDGRLCCEHNNMCVQAKDGFFGCRLGKSQSGCWQMWSEAVLGPSNEKSVSIEQSVSRRKMRPGSGCLSVSVISDGPTRVLRIIDFKAQAQAGAQFALVQEREWSCSSQQTGRLVADTSELQLQVSLKAGLGVSVVSRKPAEELLYLTLRGICLDVMHSAVLTLDCTILDIQCDNQLFEPDCCVVLYVTRGLRDDEPRRHLPAVQISLHKQPSANLNAHIFKHFIATIKNMSLTLEERLILKLYAMFLGCSDVPDTEDAEETDFETQRMVMEATSVDATRYYFEVLRLIPCGVRLSAVTCAKLPAQLQAMKRQLGLTLMKFEDAAVELEPFIKRHPFDTAQFLVNSVVKHFKQELKWQAAYILVSFDFLGNPLGFVNDVTEGVSGLLYEGSVRSFFKNVAHGLSNSAAKVTESLSDGLGRVMLDDTHEETRQRIRRLHAGTTGDHFAAGVKGLGFGVLGGVTSVFKQTYEGVANEGFQGLFSGFGKGLVGTVTKPVVGMLDFASETASAIRDSSKSSMRQAPPRCRLPRCVVGPGGLLPLYSLKQSQGQEFLYNVNDRSYSEKLVCYEILRSESEDLRILISSEIIRVFTSTALAIVWEASLCDVFQSQSVTKESLTTGQQHYIEVTARIATHMGQEAKKQPLFRCDSRDIALSVSEQINYAKALFDERSQMLFLPPYGSDD